MMKSFLISRSLRWSRGVTARQSLVRSYFIKTETTPNPESMKFLPDTTVLPAEYGTGMVDIYPLPLQHSLPTSLPLPLSHSLTQSLS